MDPSRKEFIRVIRSINYGLRIMELGITRVRTEFQNLNQTLSKLHNNKGKEILEPNHVAAVISVNVKNQIITLLNGVHNRKKNLDLFLKSLKESGGSLVE